MTGSRESVTTTGHTADPQKWVDEYGDYLFNYAMMHLRDPSLAEEMVQEAFVSALGAVEGFQGKSTERSWLVSILKHKIIDYIRKKSRRQKFASDLDPDQVEQSVFSENGRFQISLSRWSSNPLSALERQGFQKVLQSCIKALPDRLATVYTLRELEDMSTEEICKVLDISSTNLWVMLHRARLRLRGCLENNWFKEGRN